MTEPTSLQGARWLELDGEPVALLPQKALWWPREATLFVADVHLGKAATYRALGVPVPELTTADTLDRLGALINAHRVRQVIWLGDFLHAREAHQPGVLNQVLRWRMQHADVAMTLVRGNHDARAGDPPRQLGIDVVDEPHDCGRFAACHHPQTVADRIALAGHVHPVIAVHGRGRQRLRLPCFWWRPGLLILPAFGSFTGGALPERSPGARAWPVGADQVWPAVEPNTCRLAPIRARS